MRTYDLKRTAAAVITTAVAAVSLGVAAAPAASAATDVRFGTPPTTDIAEVLYGIYGNQAFAKNGINVVVTNFPAPPPVIAALQGGQLDIGMVPSTVVVSARTNGGVDLRIIAPASGPSLPDAARAKADKTFAQYVDPTGVCVKPEVTSLKQLEGQVIAVPARGALAEITISAAMREAGADPKNVRWTVLGFPQIPTAVKAGTVAGGYVGHPYTGQCLSLGLKRLGTPALSFNPNGGPVLVYVATSDYINKNPQVIKNFQKAIYQTAVDMKNKAKMARGLALVAEYTKQPLEAVTATKAPFFHTAITKAQLQKTGQAMLDLGFLTKPADVAGILLTQYKP